MPSRSATSRRAALVIAVAAAAAPAGAARAQTRVELTPFIGSYLPLADWGSMRGPFANSTFRQSIGVLGGARLAFGLSDALGLEVNGSLVNSGWTETRAATGGRNDAFSNAGISLAGRIATLDARATYRPRRANYYGQAGVAYMTRGGRAWDASIWNSAQPTVYNKSNVAGVLGGGLRAQASPAFALDVNAALYLYARDRVARGFAFQGATYSGGSMQSDLVVTVGVPIGLSGR